MSRPVSLAVAAALALGAVAAAPPQEEHVRGTVQAVSGDAVTVTTGEGKAEKLALAPDARVSTAAQADLDAITKDAFVGTTAVEARDGTLRALEVHVFPESMRGAGEGHRPWDLRGRSTMTSATVSAVDAAKPGAASTMTNANVSAVAGAGGGKKLTLAYPGGQKTVTVAPGTPVVRLAPADRSAIAIGEHVFAAGTRQPDGTVRIARMVVGQGGVVPPM